MEGNFNWLAVYTKPRFEKKLASNLNEKGIEAYLPLRKTLKQWSDRKKMVEEPLISSYVFVKVSNSSYFDVLNTTGAVKYIWFSGKPAVIPEYQIEVLRKISGSGLESECIPASMTEGSKVMITTGPLRGISGELTAFAGKKKLLIRLDNLEKAIVVSVPPGMVELKD